MAVKKYKPTTNGPRNMSVLTYDELTQLFYPEYKTRCSDFLEIWKCYEHGKMINPSL